LLLIDNKLTVVLINNLLLLTQTTRAHSLSPNEGYRGAGKPPMSKYRRPYRRPYRPARKSNSISFRSILLTILLFSSLFALIAYLPIPSTPKESLNDSAYVIDGDTVVVGKRHIRLKGID